MSNDLLRSLLHLTVAVSVPLVASAVPYTTGRLADYRYWDRLDGEALTRALRWAPPADVPRQESLNAETPPMETEELAGHELEQLAGVHALAAPVAPSRLAAEAAEPGAPPTPTQDAPPLPTLAETGAALDVADEVLGDQKTWLEGDPHVLDKFWQALEDLAKGKRSHVRIAHYGDSHLANDGLTNVSRQLLQRRFGNGGHGFVLVAGRTKWYGHKGVTRSASDGWKLVNFLNGNAKDGAYGYGGVAAEGGPGESYTLGSSKQPSSRFTLYYRSLGKAKVSATLDGKVLAGLDIGSKPGSDGVEHWTAPDRTHAMTWRVVSGRVRLFGGAMERARGLIYDSLGEVGARGTRWTNADQAHMNAVMAQRPVDLLVLNYGGNERGDAMTEAVYAQRMNNALARLRGGRSPACVIIGPSDHGVRQRGKVISDPNVVKIIGWQRTWAAKVGCAFWDSRGFMGGDGSMGKWVKQGFGWSDYSHFTGKGEQAMGVGFYRAVLKGLRDHQKRH